MSDNVYFATCFSHIRKRLNHEDNFLISSNYLTSASQEQMSDKRCYFFSDTVSSKVSIFAVSDGMGGHNAGEVASRICVEKLALVHEELQCFSSIQDVVAYLQTVIMEINEVVCKLSRENDNLKGMGATLVMFVICGNEYAVLNIGDSRVYHSINGELIQITKDNTEGQRMLDLGLLTRKELSGFPARKNLNRYIGFSQYGYVLRADEYYSTLDGGVMILCSDGISDFVSDARIAEILNSGTSLEVAGKQLIDEAVAVQNADNATVMLISLRR